MMSLIVPDGWQSWDNSPVVLFHGTVESSAAAIVKEISLGFGDPETDFGCGFYTTTFFEQAVGWADERAGESPDMEDPAVVRLTVDRVALSLLHHLAFVRGARNAVDFWRFVFHCRDGQPHMLGPESYYDVVYGPVAAVWEDPTIREVFSRFDQISFHTSGAMALLNNPALCSKEVLRDW